MSNTSRKQLFEVVIPAKSVGNRRGLSDERSDVVLLPEAGSSSTSALAATQRSQVSPATSATQVASTIGRREPVAVKPAVIDLTSDSAESSDERDPAPVIKPAAKPNKERGGSNSDAEMAVPDREERESDESEEEEVFFPFYDPTDVSETESLMDYKLERELAILQDPYAASILHVKLQPLPKELQPFKPLLMQAGIHNKPDLLANVRPHRIKRFVDFLIEVRSTSLAQRERS